MKRSFVLILSCVCALMLALFALSACGGGSSSSSSTASSSAATSDSSDDSVNPDDVSASDLSSDEIRGVFEQAMLGMSEFYKGVTPVGEQLYYAGGADGENAVFVLMVPDTGASAIFIGPVEVGDDNILTVTDETTGNQIAFQVFDNGDGTYSFSMGDQYGSAVMSRASKNEVIDALAEVVMQSANAAAAANEGSVEGGTEGETGTPQE